MKEKIFFQVHNLSIGPQKKKDEEEEEEQEQEQEQEQERTSKSSIGDMGHGAEATSRSILDILQPDRPFGFACIAVDRILFCLHD